MSTPPDFLNAWFPLVPRHRPAGLSREQRIAEVETLAASDSTDFHTFTEALNKAALIASDCGIDGVPEIMCWQQFDVFELAQPWNASVAEAAMEPLINIGRLAIRAGTGHRAYTIFRRILDAASGRATPLIGMDIVRHIDMMDAIPHDADRTEIRKQLWATALSDGTRALTRAGLWEVGLSHAQQFKGVGHRLFDGRQVEIIACYSAGDHTRGATLAADTEAPTDWERTVAALLETLCRTAGGLPVADSQKAMIQGYLNLEPDSGTIVFRTRLGLSALELSTRDEDRRAIADRLVGEAVDARDGYAALDILTHTSASAFVDEAPKKELNGYLEVSGLNQGDRARAVVRRLHEVSLSARRKLTKLLTPTG